jgi:RimJ/RimL family protein N-acetyltransferase
MNKLPWRIESARLYLRGYQPDDARWYHAMSRKNRTHLARYESMNVASTIQSVTDAEAIVRDLAAAWDTRSVFFLGAFERLTEAFVAQIYVGIGNADLPEYEIGYFADIDHEGRGYVSEAVRATLPYIFEQLGAHRVRLHCDDTNDRSIRVAERCGLIREGHLRENQRHPDGTFSGTLLYGLLRHEYAAQLAACAAAVSPGR